MDDRIDWEERSNYWELLYLRAVEGARAANRGIERLRGGYGRTQDDLRIAEARIERLLRENQALEQKVARLSLRIVAEWGRKS
jgi:hypothetical protein